MAWTPTATLAQPLVPSLAAGVIGAGGVDPLAVADKNGMTGAVLSLLNGGGIDTTLATMAAVVASSTAMAAVVASSTAMSAVAASSTARTAIEGSSTAITALAAASSIVTVTGAMTNSRSVLAATPAWIVSISQAYISNTTYHLFVDDTYSSGSLDMGALSTNYNTAVPVSRFASDVAQHNNNYNTASLVTMRYIRCS